MFWAIIGFVILVGILMLARRKQPGSIPKEKPATAARARSAAAPVIARQLVGKDYLPRTRAEIDAIFAEEQTAIPSFSNMAREAQKNADQWIDVSDEQLLGYRRAAEAARALSDGVQKKIDDLFFETESGVERYYRLIDKLDEAEADLASAVEDIVQNRKDREAGDLPVEMQRAKKKPTSKKK